MTRLAYTVKNIRIHISTDIPWRVFYISTEPVPYCNVGRRFVIPSIHRHKRMRNRGSVKMHCVENSPQNIRGYADILLQCI